MITNNWRLRE